MIHTTIVTAIHLTKHTNPAYVQPAGWLQWWHNNNLDCAASSMAKSMVSRDIGHRNNDDHITTEMLGSQLHDDFYVEQSILLQCQSGQWWLHCPPHCWGPWQTHSQKEHCHRAYLWQYGCDSALYLVCACMLMGGICVGIGLAMAGAIKVTFWQPSSWMVADYDRYKGYLVIITMPNKMSQVRVSLYSHYWLSNHWFFLEGSNSPSTRSQSGPYSWWEALEPSNSHIGKIFWPLLTPQSRQQQQQCSRNRQWWQQAIDNFGSPINVSHRSPALLSLDS